MVPALFTNSEDEFESSSTECLLLILTWHIFTFLFKLFLYGREREIHLCFFSYSYFKGKASLMKENASLAVNIFPDTTGCHFIITRAYVA